MSQAIPAITIQANVPYEFTVPESPAPASALIITNTGLVPVQWSTGQSSGYIPNGTTLAISVTAAGTVVTFSADTGLTLYITVWTINDGPVFVPQGSPITEVNLAAGATVELAAGTTVTADLAAGSTVTANLAAGSTVDLAAGTTVDINNVAGGTINIDEIASGNSLGALAVENNPLTPLSAPTVTNVGTTGTTTYYYQQRLVNQYGKTVASSVGSTTTGNATLSSTNYNNVAVQGLVVPSGIGGNLVYDSNLTNAIAPEGATWDLNGIPTGTSNGQITVVNPGTSSAQFQYTGDGTSGGRYIYELVTSQVIPGATYTFSCPINVISDTTEAYVQLYYNLGAPAVTSLTQAAGTSGVPSITITIPSGITSVFSLVRIPGTSLAAGAKDYWGPIQLTQTSTVQPYQPGPLWTIQTMRDGFWVPDMDTTLLVASDQGQAASNKVFSPFDTSGQMLQVYSTEIDSVLSPIDDVLPGFDGNGTTLVYSKATAYTNPEPGTYPGDYFSVTDVNSWYIFQTFTSRALIKQILVQLFGGSVTSPVLLALMISKANGRKIYLGTHVFITQIDIFEMLGTTGIEVDSGDELWLATSVSNYPYFVDLAVKYL